MGKIVTAIFNFTKENGRLICSTHAGLCNFEEGQMILKNYLLEIIKNERIIDLSRGKKDSLFSYAYSISNNTGDIETDSKTRLLISVDDSIKNHPAFIETKTFLKQIYKQEKKKSIEEKNRIKNLKIAKGIGVLTLAVVLLTAGPCTVKGIKDRIEIGNYENTAVGLLDRDLQIHAGEYYTGDNKAVSPFQEHDCVIGGPEKGSVEERIRLYCIQNDIDNRIEEAALKKYYLLYNDKKEGFDIDLRYLMELIEKENTEKSKGK